MYVNYNISFYGSHDNVYRIFYIVLLLAQCHALRQRFELLQRKLLYKYVFLLLSDITFIAKVINNYITKDVTQ